MNRYTISVENRRGANTNYAIMMDTPEFTGDQEPWLNVWYTMFIPFHGSFEVNTGDDFYAWVGTVPTSPTPGVVVFSGMSLLGRLGSEGVPGSTFEMQNIESFPTIQEIDPSATKGSYEFKTGKDFSMPNNTYLVGLAKVNHRGQVSPVGSVAPKNDQRIQATPKMRFFVAESQPVPAVARAGKFYATVTQGNDGGFTMKYYDSFD
ncbi:hypothetical protein BO99DRAFT_433329 [Aspergillus violaceofuscus CBS 115571]|uniref:Uncharacterized protein n=1 Tax=Aspergillus violaceofuscus (strain CBS 115571) TaxID=1450538 RepID=A0A2V5H3M4_ASPV1|nr:hypothetical protein BO99DRAFT_433329 [Aspergillus violaceofuscus CBS 115571]